MFGLSFTKHTKGPHKVTIQADNEHTYRCFSLLEAQTVINWLGLRPVSALAFS